MLKPLIPQNIKFIARTVLVKDNNVDDAMKIVNRIMGSEGLLDQFRRTQRYEKPFQTRRRINHERCKAIYNEDMSRKIQFLMKVNRVDPYPGC
ncbi:small ribosomal subunit protein bS21m-like [Artemia franciscana]|uniref:small ribosomal subunit protein bS21m-like n=1 Tax=Artemia franciscana TaxID=6661 RepID=UPI0032D9F35D